MQQRPFHGQSGSPIFQDIHRDRVIGVVTRNIAFTSGQGDNITSAFYGAIGASLTPIVNWVKSL